MVLGLTSTLCVFVTSCLIRHPEEKRDLYKTLRFTSFAHVILFPSIALTGIYARWEGGKGGWTVGMVLVTLGYYEMGEMSYT